MFIFLCDTVNYMENLSRNKKINFGIAIGGIIIVIGCIIGFLFWVFKPFSSSSPALPDEKEPCPSSFACHGFSDPVCGSNGQVYFNECYLKREACTSSGEGLEVACLGECPCKTDSA